MRHYLLLILFALLPVWTMAQSAGNMVKSPTKSSKTTKPAKSTKSATKSSAKPAATKSTAAKTTPKKSTSNSSSTSEKTTPYTITPSTPVAAKETKPSKAAAKANQTIIQNIINNMVYVAGGSFDMGGTPDQGKRVDRDEKPVHNVTLSSFTIGKYEVTQEEWEAVMGTNPSGTKGARLPVADVSWEECQKFIEKLNSLTGHHFRLPTEAEWEYAARGGNKSRRNMYAGANNLSNVAWSEENSGSQPHNVGQLRPNELGIYDMSGNVWEWCEDGYESYKSEPVTNPRLGGGNSRRVRRGGSWSTSQNDCRTGKRDGHSGSRSGKDVGFRLAQ